MKTVVVQVAARIARISKPSIKKELRPSFIKGSCYL